MSEHLIQKIKKRAEVKKDVAIDSQARAARILRGANPAQRLFIIDESKYKSGRCPRRSGKSFGAASLALYVGEKIQGARILIVSLTLKSTKENYWSGPGGIFAQNAMYSLGLTFNMTDVTWVHQNGSRGRLAGAETRADMEYLRGAAAEADIIILDECKSFAPSLLTELIRDVLEPGLMTRNGTLVMIGTPGSIPIGPFYEATEPTYRNPETGKPGCIVYDGKPLDIASGMYSLHTWTVQDNEAKPQQWERALRIKEKAGWADDNPVWRREFLGEWNTDVTELVYAYAKHKPTGNVTWFPNKSKENPTGLPPEAGPWHLIMGLDFGYEDSNAIVLAAYSEVTRELRHVYDFKQNHMTIDEFGKEIRETIDIFGFPEVIVGDKGSLGGVLYIQELNSRFGLGIVEAEKREKFDHIELLNSDFHSGRIKIIPDSELEYELCGLQWDLEKDKTILIRTGKLREDPSCPNHLCDALLYLWRYCYHYWAMAADGPGPARGTNEWIVQQEQESIRRYRAKLLAEKEREVSDSGIPYIL